VSATVRHTVKVALTWDDVLLSAQKVADGLLLHVGVLLLEVVCERESDYGKTSVVGCAILALVVLLLALLELEVTLLAVDVTDTAEPAGVLQRPAQQARIGECVLHDAAESIEPQVDQVVCSR
jgi:hypothetical protein